MTGVELVLPDGSIFPVKGKLNFLASTIDPTLGTIASPGVHIARGNGGSNGPGAIRAQPACGSDDGSACRSGLRKVRMSAAPSNARAPAASSIENARVSTSSGATTPIPPQPNCSLFVGPTERVAAALTRRGAARIVIGN